MTLMVRVNGSSFRDISDQKTIDEREYRARELRTYGSACTVGHSRRTTTNTCYAGTHVPPVRTVATSGVPLPLAVAGPSCREVCVGAASVRDGRVPTATFPWLPSTSLVRPPPPSRHLSATLPLPYPATYMSTTTTSIRQSS